jgi:integrase
MEKIMRVARDGQRGLSRRIGFTVDNLTRAKCPAGKNRVWIYDQRQPGLCLMITSTGAKSFYLYRKVNGRPQRVRLGGFPDITVEQARKSAAKKIAGIADGMDPMKAKRQAKVRGVTIGQLWQWFEANYSKTRKRSWKADQTRYKVHLAKWAKRPAADVTMADVTVFHADVAKATTDATANRVLSLLSAIYRRATAAGQYVGANPCSGVPRFPETSRERYLLPEELPRFFKALKEEPSDGLRDFFELCLWTGARSGNVKSMRWEELRLDQALWAIPAAKAKAGKALLVHLPAEALAILRRRQTASTSSAFVFPASSASGHLARPSHAWDELVKRAKLPGLRIHDLRRTLGSWQAATGASLPIIGKSLGHASQQTTAIYARLQLDPVRESVNKAAEAISKAAIGTDSPQTPTPGDEAAMI